MGTNERRREDLVALVCGGGEGVGREIALMLAAHGLRVVVTGGGERALGEVVGEIANGGGKARHLAGGVCAAARKALDAFGALDVVVAEEAEAGPALDAALASVTGPRPPITVTFRVGARGEPVVHRILNALGVALPPP